MKKYELTVVINPNLDEEAIKAELAAVQALVERFGGTIEKVDEWGKRRLAYEIQKMKEAYYYFIQFESDSVCPNEVEAHVRIMEQVIRYLCVRQDA